MTYKMKYLLAILFFTTVQNNLFGQPAPCMDEPINIVEIQDTDFNNTNVLTGNIGLKRTPDNYKWNDILIKDSIDAQKLIFENFSYEYCSNIVYKSELKNRFYYTGSIENEILIIQNGSKKMFIVFPSNIQNNIIAYDYFLISIADSINHLNIVDGKRAHYYPYKYISGIEFKEGIFFIKDYEKKSGIKPFNSEEIIEFYSNTTNDYKGRINPLNYWNENVYFISPFDESRGPEYAKTFYGNYTENQAIELIVKNHPSIIEKILESSTSIIKNTEHRTQHQKDLFEIWHGLLRRNVVDKEFALRRKYESDKSSIDEVYKEYKEFQKTEFFSILKSDFDLTIKYYNYFIDEKADLKEFKEFIQKNNLKFSKEQLELFIDNKK